MERKMISEADKSEYEDEVIHIRVPERPLNSLVYIMFKHTVYVMYST